LALSMTADAILLDDEEAHVFARKMSLKVKGTLGILVDCVEIGELTREMALTLLRQLNQLMYLSADLYSYVFDRINEFGSNNVN